MGYMLQHGEFHHKRVSTGDCNRNHFATGGCNRNRFAEGGYNMRHVVTGDVSTERSCKKKMGVAVGCKLQNENV